MASTKFGRKLDPYRKLRDPLGIKGARHSVVITNNPSSIDQNQQLLVRFPNLGSYDVIVPGTARLAFTISLISTDDNRTVVQNLGRAVVKKTTIKISGNEVLSIDDSDVLHCYLDLWKTTRERENAQYQGIDTSLKRNITLVRLGAANGVANVKSTAIKDAYGNRFYVPLDFELLESHMPFYQSALGDRLEYELTFNDYNRVIHAEDDSDASYSIGGISLEFDVVTQPELARMVRNQYTGQIAILYDRVLRHRKIKKDKSDTLWNINLNVPARSMKGILMLFEDSPSAFARTTESFYNPKIEKVEVTIEGIPNQLYSQGMRAYQQWDECQRREVSRRWQQAVPRSGGGRERPGAGRRLLDRLFDHQIRPVARPPDERRRPASRQWPARRKCVGGCDDPDHKNGGDGRRIEHLPVRPYGRAAKHRK